MRRLVCAFAVRIFSRRDPTIYVDLADGDTVDRDGLLYILQVCAHVYARLSLHWMEICQQGLRVKLK